MSEQNTVSIEPVVVGNTPSARLGQVTFQVSLEIKALVNALAIKLGMTHNVKAEGGLTGNPSPLYRDMIRFALAHLDMFIAWRSSRDHAAVLGVVENKSE
jgi:hypothetical protein